MQIYIGKVILILWALLMAFVGYKLVEGQGAVVLTAIEAGRVVEAVMQTVFITLVTVATVAAIALFIVVGILNE